MRKAAPHIFITEAAAEIFAKLKARVARLPGETRRGRAAARRGGGLIAGCPLTHSGARPRVFSSRAIPRVATDTENALATRAESLRTIAEVA